jgi:phosphoglucosamine mutase
MVEAITSEKAPLSKLVKEYKVFPQVHLNVPVSKKEDFALYPEIVKTKDEIEDRLADRGRFSLRYSGTEYLARIMVEGQEQKELEDLASRMAEVISRHLG